MPPRDLTMIPSTIEPVIDITRRRLLTAIPALTLIAGGVSCGDDDDGGDSTPTAGATNTPGKSAYPVTLKHAFGETVIEQEPKRIVTVGFTDHDILLALGVVPIALRDWYGDQPNGVWPWAQEKLGAAKPELLAGELDIEAIAALEPDLILGLYVGLLPEDYANLSKIAPTVAQSGDHANYGTPWQEMTRTAGLAVGREEQAEGLIASVDAHIASARKEHPEFEGKKLVYAGVAEGGVVYVETDASTRVGILGSLGFVVPDEINALVTDSFYVELSQEQLRLLDQEIVFWELGAAEGARPGIESNPVYQSLAVSKEGRHVFVDDLITAGALAHADVLSIPFFIDGLVPRLAAALDSDPATSSD